MIIHIGFCSLAAAPLAAPKFTMRVHTHPSAGGNILVVRATSRATYN